MLDLTPEQHKEIFTALNALKNGGAEATLRAANGALANGAEQTITKTTMLIALLEIAAAAFSGPSAQPEAAGNA